MAVVVVLLLLLLLLLAARFLVAAGPLVVLVALMLVVFRLGVICDDLALGSVQGLSQEENLQVHRLEQRWNLARPQPEHASRYPRTRATLLLVNV